LARAGPLVAALTRSAQGYVRDFADFEVDVETFVQQWCCGFARPHFAGAFNGRAVMLRSRMPANAGSTACVVGADDRSAGHRTGLAARTLLRVLRLAGQAALRPGGSAGTRPNLVLHQQFLTKRSRALRPQCAILRNPTLGIASRTVAWADIRVPRDAGVFARQTIRRGSASRFLMLAASSDSVVSTSAIEESPYHFARLASRDRRREAEFCRNRTATRPVLGGVRCVSYRARRCLSEADPSSRACEWMCSAGPAARSADEIPTSSRPRASHTAADERAVGCPSFRLAVHS